MSCSQIVIALGKPVESKVCSRGICISAPPELTSQMALNGFLANSENLCDLGTTESLAEFFDSAGIGTRVRVAGTCERFTAPES
jgi:hypothetical protein